MVIKRILKINNSLPELFNFQNYFHCHNNRHILRLYEWDLLVFCKQTPFQLAAIGTLNDVENDVKHHSINQSINQSIS